MTVAGLLRLLSYASGALAAAAGIGCAGASFYDAYRTAHPEWSGRTPMLGADLEATVAGLFAPPKGQYQVLPTRVEIFRTDVEPWRPISLEELRRGSRRGAGGDYVVIANLTCISVVELVTHTDDKSVWYLLPDDYLVAYDHFRFTERCTYFDEFAPAEQRHADVEARIAERIRKGFARRLGSDSLYLRGLAYFRVGRLDAARTLLAEGDAQFDPTRSEWTQRTTQGARYRVNDAERREANRRALRRALAEGDAALAGAPAPSLEPVGDAFEREQLVGALVALADHSAGQRSDEVAERLRRRALSIEETSAGASSDGAADALQGLGWLLRERRPEESEQLLRRALEIREGGHGPESLAAADTLIALGAVLRDHRKVKEARECHERALALSRSSGQADEEGARTIEALALLNLGLDASAERDFGAAKGKLVHALRIQEARFGPRHPELALYLEWVGRICHAIGDWDMANGYLERLVDIQRRFRGPSHPDTADALALAATPSTAAQQGQLDRALEIYDESLPDDDPRLVGALLKRAETLPRDRALALIERALAIATQQGEATTDVAWCLRVRGNFEFALGRLDAARRDWQRSLEIYRAHYPPDDQVLGSLALEIGTAEAIAGNPERAWAHLFASFAVTRANLPRFLGASSEGATIGLQDELARLKSVALSLVLRDPSASESQRRLPAEAALLLKGRGLTIARRHRSQLAQSANAVVLAELSRLDASIARLALEESDAAREDAIRGQLVELAKERAKVTASLSSHASAPASAPSFDQIVRALPAGALVIDYEVFSPLDFDAARTGAPGSRTEAAHYAALVLRPNGGSRWLDLGPVGAVELDIEKLIDGVGRITGSPEEPAMALYDRLLAPLEDEIDASELLLISPDEELATLPFEALLDPASRFLIERIPLTYLSSLEEIAMARSSRPLGPPLVMGGPNFDARPPSEPEQGALLASVRSALPEQQGFAPLPGAVAEARALAGLWGDAVVVSGDEASEGRLRAFRAPRILHLATHGYFLPRFGPMGEATWSVRTRADTPLGVAIPYFDSSLLGSGLAFAGANRGGGSSDDGLLSALEAADLDLHGTRLVTLSACETGLGEVTAYEGISGLRRAFSVAGAETVVMSLWRVPDATTVDLMKSFYQGLARGESRAEALQNAKQHMLNQGRHPYEWAAFIASGDWRTLD